MINFIYAEAEKPKPLTFGDVEIDQFFVSESGELYQKVTRGHANMIASDSGRPCSNNTSAFDSKCHIQRILPKVERIEF